MDDEKFKMTMEERLHNELIEGKITQQEYNELMELEKLVKNNPEISKIENERVKLEKEILKKGKQIKVYGILITIISLSIIVKVVLELIRILNN